MQNEPKAASGPDPRILAGIIMLVGVIAGVMIIQHFATPVYFVNAYGDGTTTEYNPVATLLGVAVIALSLYWGVTTLRRHSAPPDA